MGQWHRQVGDQVKAGEVLFSYETDKASFEEEAKEDGELLAIFFNEGEEVPVLANVAVIGKRGERIDEFSPIGKPAATGSRTTTPSITDKASPSSGEAVPVNEGEEFILGVKQDRRIRISPLAKVMAKRLGVAYEQVRGSGPYGRIVARDITAITGSLPETVSVPNERYFVSGEEEKSAKPVTKGETPVPVNPVYGEDFEVKKLSNIRRLVSEAMYRSLQNSAQLTHHMSADARNMMALRKQLKKDFETGKIRENITINTLVCFAVVRALERWAQVNTHFLGDSMRWFKKVHLGIAVDTERGLMVPVVRNADDLSLEGLSSRINSLITQCRKGNINPELLSPEAATFTVSNLGNYGVEIFTPILNLPQAAILGVCTITPRPKDLGDGVFGFVPMMGLSLTYNHQALDGGEATLFLWEIKEQIENI
jgi:pyruvate dehydrogenase E2 component (dihydrolipoamide acetyltransferase)